MIVLSTVPLHAHDFFQICARDSSLDSDESSDITVNNTIQYDEDFDVADALWSC